MADLNDLAKLVRSGIYSMKTVLLHGRAKNPLWDYNHHVVPPISASTTYRLDSTARGAQGFVEFANKKMQKADAPIYIYDRLQEPARGMLEEQLALAEAGESCTTFATGMGAIAAAFGVTARAGEHIVSHAPIYGCTYSLLTNWMPRQDVAVTFTDVGNLDLLRKEIRPETRVVYFESPVNPTLQVIDIRGVHRVVKEFNEKRPEAEKIEIVVDNTFATPFCQRPMDLGADIVVESLTKGIGGFGIEMGGALICKQRYESSVLLYRKDFGGVLAPSVAWSILTHGLPTLAMRMRRQQETALRVAEFLADQDKIAEVRYPGLPGSAQYELARSQMVDWEGNFAPGNMLCFVMKGSPAEAGERAKKLCDTIAEKAYCVTLAVSLGQIRTLLESPGAMTHSAVPAEEQARSGIVQGMVRLSVGIEDPHDIIRDLNEALKAL